MPQRHGRRTGTFHKLAGTISSVVDFSTLLAALLTATAAAVLLGISGASLACPDATTDRFLRLIHPSKAYCVADNALNAARSVTMLVCSAAMSLRSTVWVMTCARRWVHCIFAVAWLAWLRYNPSTLQKNTPHMGAVLDLI